MTQITYTRATFITGHDDKGNEYFYFKTLEGDWWDGYNERVVTDSYFANEMFQRIVKVRFGDLEVTSDEWLTAGCPYELSSVEIAGWMERKPAFVRDVTEIYPDSKVMENGKALRDGLMAAVAIVWDNDFPAIECVSEIGMAYRAAQIEKELNDPFMTKDNAFPLLDEYARLIDALQM